MSDGVAERLARLESFVEAEAALLDMIGGHEPLERSLGELIRRSEAQIPGSTTAITLHEDDGSTRHLVADAPDGGRADDDDAGDGDGDGRDGDGGASTCTTPIVGTDDERLGELTSTLDDGRAHDELEHRLLAGFARLARVVVERHREQLRVATTIADERRKIAENLHDDPIQVVTAANLRLQRLARTATGDQLETVREVQASLTGAITRMRRMLFELHPPSLDDEGLGAAIENYLSEVFDPVDVGWELDEELDREPSHEVGSLAYRLVREALWNAAKHAEASSVDVALRRVDGRLEVRVSDDGAGFDPRKRLRTRARHLGMNSCRDMARRAAGSWDVDSAPGRGTTVTFSLPDP